MQSVRAHAHACMHIRTCVLTRACVVCVCVYMCVRVCVCVCRCMCTCVCTCVCVYQVMATILREYGVPRELVAIIEELHSSETWCQVRSAGDTSERFEVTTGVHQGCVLSPLLFTCFLDRILREAMINLNGGLQIGYTTSEGLFLTYRDKTTASTSIQDALYADDLTLVAESWEELQDMVNAINNTCR